MLKLMELIDAHRIVLPTEDAQLHMLRTIAFAVECGRYDHLVERLNYIAPRDDESIFVYRDGRPEEHCFFWKQYTMAEYNAAAVEFAKWRVPDRQTFDDFMPARRTYHGGLIMRGAYNPIEWTIHT